MTTERTPAELAQIRTDAVASLRANVAELEAALQTPAADDQILTWATNGLCIVIHDDENVGICNAIKATAITTTRPAVRVRNGNHEWVQLARRGDVMQRALEEGRDLIAQFEAFDA